MNSIFSRPGDAQRRREALPVRRRFPALPTERIQPRRAATEQPPLGGAQFVLVNFGLMLGHVLVLFNSGAFAGLTLHATGDLGVSPSHGSWLTTYYFVSLALALPVASWLSGRFGEVRLFTAAMLGLALGSGLCGLAGDLSAFIAGRIVQGFCGGIAIPVSQALLLREYPADKKAFALSLWSIAALSPFTLGPVTGGWIADKLGWRWLFHLNVPLALISGGLAWALLPERPNRRRPGAFDRIGFALLAAALAFGQTVLNRGQDEDWYNSPLIIGFAAASLLALIAFIVWELGEREPLVDLRLFARRNFAVGTIGLTVAFLIMYGLLSLLLVRLQSVAGYTAFLAGSVTVPLAFLAKPVAVFLQRIARRFDARLLASLNLLAFAAFSWWTSGYDFFGRRSLFADVIGSQVLEGLCLGGLFVPLTVLFLSGLSPRRQVQAVELGGMLRVLGGSIGSPLIAVLWDRRTAFHQSRLGEALSAYDPSVNEAFTALYAAGFKTQAASAELVGWVHRHAAVLGFDDAFRWAAWAFLGLAALVWLARPAAPPPPATSKEAVRQTALKDLVEEP